mmetsp:Transcript_13215/g.19923  ORF Transcript_13215/g.19923 Transcript_13215/m.19923 type:complete len:738 (+) Transcript_13215:62-2275(+)
MLVIQQVTKIVQYSRYAISTRKDFVRGGGGGEFFARRQFTPSLSVLATEEEGDDTQNVIDAISDIFDEDDQNNASNNTQTDYQFEGETDDLDEWEMNSDDEKELFEILANKEEREKFIQEMDYEEFETFMASDEVSSGIIRNIDVEPTEVANEPQDNNQDDSFRNNSNFRNNADDEYSWAREAFQKPKDMTFVDDDDKQQQIENLRKLVDNMDQNGSVGSIDKSDDTTLDSIPPEVDHLYKTADRDRYLRDVGKTKFRQASMSGSVSDSDSDNDNTDSRHDQDDEIDQDDDDENNAPDWQPVNNDPRYRENPLKQSPDGLFNENDDEEFGVDELYPLEASAEYWQGRPHPILAGRTKERIWQQHITDPERWSVENLARAYSLRASRVRAILQLKADEKQMERDRGQLIDPKVEKVFEQVYGAVSSFDEGFKPNESLPTAPSMSFVDGDIDQREASTLLSQGAGRFRRKYIRPDEVPTAPTPNIPPPQELDPGLTAAFTPPSKKMVFVNNDSDVAPMERFSVVWDTDGTVRTPTFRERLACIFYPLHAVLPARFRKPENAVDPETYPTYADPELIKMNTPPDVMMPEPLGNFKGLHHEFSEAVRYEKNEKIRREKPLKMTSDENAADFADLLTSPSSKPTDAEIWQTFKALDTAMQTDIHLSADEEMNPTEIASLGIDEHDKEFIERMTDPEFLEQEKSYFLSNEQDKNFVKMGEEHPHSSGKAPPLPDWLKKEYISK